VADDETVTLTELLHHGTVLLQVAGLPGARREAQRLWADLERTSLSAVTLAGSERVDEERASRYFAAVRLRACGAPIALATGWTGFRHLELACDRRALIPRPETEVLVELALSRQATGLAADLGTGTGAIALSLRQEGRFDEVVGVDLSAEALALARENGRQLGLPVTWIEGDLVAPLIGRRFDLLVSNPPYLTEAECDALDESVRDFEPRMALDGGPDGLGVVRRLLQDGGRALQSGGWLAMEVDSRRSEQSGAIARESGWSEVRIVDDLFGRPRYLLARWEHAE
jgi:release factor glutamine methyltransferase